MAQLVFSKPGGMKDYGLRKKKKMPRKKLVCNSKASSVVPRHYMNALQPAQPVLSRGTLLLGGRRVQIIGPGVVGTWMAEQQPMHEIDMLRFFLDQLGRHGLDLGILGRLDD